MANLFGQNIGTNYKGILNLNTLNGNLSGTLESVTDGDGNASPLRLSTSDLAVTQGGINRLLISTDITMRRSDNTLFFQYSNAPDVLELNGNTIRLNTLRGNTAIGHSVASARLHVRGDGTNPIARFENSTGAALLIGTGAIGNRIWSSNSSSATLDINIGGAVLTGQWITGQGHSFQVTNVTMSQTSGTSGSLLVGNTFAAGAGSANYRPIQVEYTINNSGAQTGTATGIFLNATETALNGMTHNLMDLQVGGNSRFSVNRGGTIIAASYIYGAAFGSNSRMVLKGSSADGIAIITNNAENDFNRLQFGGTTNAFPALKRSAAELQCVLADDSGRADFRCKAINTTLITNSSDNIININNTQYVSTAGVSIANSTLNSSAILQADSTTRGFLPPRGTNAQMLAIATPATGLVFYDTTNNKLNVYDGTNWVAMH